MNQEIVAKLMEQWMNDEEFRAAIRRDPEGTIKASGLDLSEEQWAAFRKVDWSLSDEELTARANAQGSLCAACGVTGCDVCAGCGC